MSQIRQTARVMHTEFLTELLISSFIKLVRNASHAKIPGMKLQTTERGGVDLASRKGLLIPYFIAFRKLNFAYDIGQGGWI